MQDEYREVIMQALEKAFGVPARGHSLESQILATAEGLAQEYWENYSRQICDIVAGSFLSDYVEDNIRVAFRQAASARILPWSVGTPASSKGAISQRCPTPRIR